MHKLIGRRKTAVLCCGFLFSLDAFPAREVLSPHGKCFPCTGSAFRLPEKAVFDKI
ncbi:MAG: hypothetical protein IKH45_05180 [Neisseriaceae bacterium]|nr:hypothetical protein [Neisseriaceae bacterium]